MQCKVNLLPIKFADIVGIPLMYWENVSGEENDIEVLMNFYNSEYYRNMPVVDIQAKLYAKALTHEGKIKSGDVKDIINISSMAVYFNVLLVDNTMKNRVKELLIDKDYDFQIFSIKDIDEIYEYFNSL